jgi:hypothetical protein
MNKTISRAAFAGILAATLIGSTFLSTSLMAQYRSYSARPQYNPQYGPPPPVFNSERFGLAPSIQEFYSSANGG